VTNSVPHTNVVRKTAPGMSACWPILLLAILSLLRGSAYGDISLDSTASWATRSAGYTHAVAWADVDRDGDLDLACGNSGTRDDQEGGRNYIYLNQDGELEPYATWESDEQDVTECLAWGDVNQDGWLDLACGSYNGPVRIYLNLGGDYLLASSASWSTDSAWITRSLAFADINGDGWLDLVCGNDGQPNVLFLNHAGTLSTAPDWRSTESDQTWSLECGDIDRDGDVDLVVGNNDRPARLYRNHGAGLDDVAAWNSDSISSFSVALGDINGDGWLDLVCGRDEGPDVLYLNLAADTAGFSATPDWISFDATGTKSVRLGDCDLDGDLDLAVGFDGLANRIILNDNGTLADSYAWTSDEVDQTADIVWGDVNGDGRLDLAAANAGQPDRVYRNLGRVLSPSYAWISNLDTYTSSISWGDMNNDGLPDLACGGMNAANHVYLNNGGALNTDPDWVASDTVATTQVLWVDLDGIGGQDLVCANRGAPNQVYYNVGTILSSAPVDISSDSDQTNGIALGDLDGDGDLDLACANGGEPNRVYLNVGGSFATPAVWSSVDNDATTSVVWADIDRDGDLDLICGNGVNDGQLNRIYYNQNGRLDSISGWTSVSTESEQTNDICVFDPDGDGDLDLAVAESYAANRLYTNFDGNLATSADWNSIDEANSMSLAWADIDGDGDPDLAAGNYSVAGSADVLYLNDKGHLDPYPFWTSLPTDRTKELAFADFDLDGDVDLAAGCNKAEGIYDNLLADAWRQSDNLPNNPGYIDSVRIDSWDQTTNRIGFSFRLVDPEFDDAALRVEYSELGLNGWRRASVDISEDLRLTTSPQGELHSLTWTVDADMVDGYDVWVRFIVTTNPDWCGTIQRPSQVYQMRLGRVQGKPRIAVLYPSKQPTVTDSLVLLGSIWDATNFSEYRLMLNQYPESGGWEQLFVSGSPISQPAQVASLDLSDRAAADYVLRVICHDRNGDSTVVDKMFTLSQKPDRAPSVLGHFPQAGIRLVPGNSPVVVWFDQNMNQSAVNMQTFVLESETGERYSNALYDYKTRTLTIIPDHLYSVSGFHYSVVNDRFAGQQGTPLGGEYVSSFTTCALPPTAEIDSLTPGLGNTDVSLTADSIIVHYGQASEHHFVTVFTLEGDTIVNGAVSGPWFRKTAALGPLTPSTYYLVRISDDPGFDGPSDYMSYFITEDNLAPDISDFYPADSAWLVALDEPITVYFNKEINPFSVDETSFMVIDSSGPVPGNLNFGVAGGGSVVSFSADRPFYPRTEHVVTLTSQIQDNIGNSIAGQSWTFTTGIFEDIDFSGGRISSDSVDVFFPQGSLDGARLVGLGEIPPGRVEPGSDLQIAGAVFELEPDLALDRPAVVTVILSEATGQSVAVDVPCLNYYDSVAGSWQYHGGTVEGNRLSASIDRLGLYGVFIGSGEATTADEGLTLSLLPRVISPSSGGDNAELRIAFTLAAPDNVTVKVYSSAGRLVTTVASDCSMSAGENLLAWNGRDERGRLVNDGLYILVIDAGGERRQKTFVVVNN